MSAQDPAARNCCRGGDELEKGDSGPQPVLVRAHGTPAIPVSIPTPADVPARRGFEVRPSPGPLYSLHSILLL